MPRVCRHTRTRGASPREPGSTGIGAQRIGRPLDHGRARLLALLALSGRAAFLAPQKGARARPRRPALSQCKVRVGGRARKSLEPQSTPPLGRHRPPEDRLGQHGRALQGQGRGQDQLLHLLRGGRGHLEALAAVQHLL